uniref:Ig-like domain-containing protein n=1 Tax=Pundamilia nyererei TaxID=303518 RepID=A0A3B4F8E6_9CICH
MSLCFLFYFERVWYKHSLMYFITGSSGIPNIPDLAAFAEVDGVEVGYCDINNQTIQPRQDWVKQALDNYHGHLRMYTYYCFYNLPDFFTEFISILKRQSNQTGGVHIVQKIEGCEWNENTGEVNGVLQYGYDGEGFLEFDFQRLTWIPLKPEAVIFTENLISDRNDEKDYFTKICPHRLKWYLDIGKSSMQRTVLPSVSLLQKTPSSPVTCHATGFYPGKAVMFWRKDGNEIHENKGEILHNHDGTFQLSVNMNASSVPSEDWTSYSCVFQFSGVEDNIITKLNKSTIRTNWGKIKLAMMKVRNTVDGLIRYKEKNCHPPLAIIHSDLPEVQSRMICRILHTLYCKKYSLNHLNR